MCNVTLRSADGLRMMSDKLNALQHLDCLQVVRQNLRSEIPSTADKNDCSGGPLRCPLLVAKRSALMIVANVVPRPPRTEMEKQKRSLIKRNHE